VIVGAPVEGSWSCMGLNPEAWTNLKRRRICQSIA